MQPSGSSTKPLGNNKFKKKNDSFQSSHGIKSIHWCMLRQTCEKRFRNCCKNFKVSTVKSSKAVSVTLRRKILFIYVLSYYCLIELKPKFTTKQRNTAIVIRQLYFNSTRSWKYKASNLWPFSDEFVNLKYKK